MISETNSKNNKITNTKKITNKKKTTTKKTTKKTSGSTRRKARIVKKKVFEEIPEEKFFILVDGSRLKHYVELADRLEHMSIDMINHHVTPFRHDFSNWIRDVFEEHELAKELLKINNPEKMRSKIYQHIIRKYLK